MLNVLHTVIGLGLIFLGRKLFWLFAAFIGVLAGLFYHHHFLGQQPEYIVIAVAFLLGITGALLAIFFQTFMVGLTGFLAGAYITLYVCHELGVDYGQFMWLICLIGGILGTALLSFIFDWGLIVISSVLGASLVTKAIDIDPDFYQWAFMGMVILGCAVQARMLGFEAGSQSRRNRRLA